MATKRNIATTLMALGLSAFTLGTMDSMITGSKRVSTLSAERRKAQREQKDGTAALAGIFAVLAAAAVLCTDQHEGSRARLKLIPGGRPKDINLG